MVIDSSCGEIPPTTCCGFPKVLTPPFEAKDLILLWYWL